MEPAELQTALASLQTTGVDAAVHKAPADGSEYPDELRSKNALSAVSSKYAQRHTPGQSEVS